MEPRYVTETGCTGAQVCTDPGDGLRWRLARGGAVPADAWVAGYQRMAEAAGPFYLCRVWSAVDGFSPRQAVPGKLAAGYGGCRVTNGGTETEVTTAYEVLVGPLPAPRSPDRGPIAWIRVAAGGALPDWVEGLGGSPTCRGRHTTGVHPGGRVLPGGGCLFGDAGRGYLARQNPYEVLAWSPTSTPRNPRPFPAPTPGGPLLRSTGPTLPRAEQDRADEVPGMQVHLVYALASNSPDMQRDILGHINDQVEVAQRWLMAQVGRRLRFDTHGGIPDVTVLRLPQTWQEIQRTGVDTVLRMAMRNAGLRVAHKYNMVFYEGPKNDGDCGAYAGEGTNGVIFLRRVDAQGALLPCAYTVWAARENPILFANGRSTIAKSLVHEIFHGLGIAPTCAPDYEGRLPGQHAHLSTRGTDVMSIAPSGTGLTLDSTRTQYYGHGRPGCRDLMNSAAWEDATKGDPIPGRERW